MIYADMHCDTVSELYRKRQAGSREGLYENTGHVDLVRMKKGGAMLQNFALYVNMGKSRLEKWRPFPQGMKRSAK